MKNKKGFIIHIEQMLNYEYWEFYEAIYLLSGYRPEYTIITAIAGVIAERMNRTFIYTDRNQLNKNIFPSNVRRILSLLKEAIEVNDELFISPIIFPSYACYGKKMSYVLHSGSVITWALRKGIIFPLEFRSILDIYQLEISCTSSLKNITATQTIAQYLLKKNPSINISQICHHELMRKIGPQYLDNEKKAIRRSVLKILNNKRKRGRPSQQHLSLKNAELRPLSNVLQQDEETYKYSIPLLEVVISTMVKIYIYINGEAFKHFTEIEFIKNIFNNEIIDLYLKNASPILQELCKYFCLLEMSSYYSHYKISKIPSEQRKKLTIKQLMDLNRALCFSMLSEEEKKKHHISINSNETKLLLKKYFSIDSFESNKRRIAKII